MNICALRIDREYRNTNNWKDPRDIFNNMFRQFPDCKGIQNAGGFRYRSKLNKSEGIEQAPFIVLVTNFGEIEWPDSLELETGIFTYFGDNRTSGNPIEKTRVGGNRLLSLVFGKLHKGERHEIPPFIIFQNLKRNKETYMKFLGLAVPGAVGLSSIEDLVAIWRVQNGQRFQNYRAKFTILREESVSWKWLVDLVSGVFATESDNCPASWEKWVKFAKINALKCKTDKTPRSKNAQLPQNKIETKILKKILTLTAREFEYASRELLFIMDKNFINLEVTPRIRDRGHDIIGFYKIGNEDSALKLSVHGEAKRWATGSIGVKPMSRLISRIKHKDLGVFIATSYFDKQVQEEILEDGHPIILISGRDIVRILMDNELAGPNSEDRLEDWIQSIKNQTDA